MSFEYYIPNHCMCRTMCLFDIINNATYFPKYDKMVRSGRLQKIDEVSYNPDLSPVGCIK